MEYYGGTISSLSALRHEVVHSYFGCTVVMRTYPDSWMDEAITSWFEEMSRGVFHPVLATTYRGNWVGARSPVSVGFSVIAYTDGASIMQDIANRLGGTDRMTDFLRSLVERRTFAPFTTLEFVGDLAAYSGIDLRAQFLTWLYNGREPAVTAVAASGPATNEKTLDLDPILGQEVTAMSPRTRGNRLFLLRLQIVLMTGGLLCLAGLASAQSPAGESRRWQIELVGGLTGLRAGDLNAQADYETALLDQLRTVQIQQSHQGALVKLDRAFPIGGRVVRRLGDHWSAGAGFTFFSARERSAAQASYQYTVVDPHAQEFQRAFDEAITVDPLLLRVREYMPHLLVRYDRPLGRRVRVGASLHTGWVFADCRLEQAQSILGGFYPVNRTSTQEMTGKGSSLAGSAWLLARVSITGRLGLLVEGGRTWHDVKNVTGSGTWTSVTQDGEATEVELTQTRQADGRWLNQPVTYQSAAGSWHGTVPSHRGPGKPVLSESLGLAGEAGCDDRVVERRYWIHTLLTLVNSRMPLTPSSRP